MNTLEFMVPRADTEAFNTAVYRFLERRSSAGVDDILKLKTEPLGPVHRKTVTLWSEAAVRDFAVFWTSFRKTMDRPQWAMA